MIQGLYKGGHSVLKAVNLCKYCNQAHGIEGAISAINSILYSHMFVRHKGNWKQRQFKKEAKKSAPASSYVGDNATKTSIIYAWGGAVSGALGK